MASDLVLHYSWLKALVDLLIFSIWKEDSFLASLNPFKCRNRNFCRKQSIVPESNFLDGSYTLFSGVPTFGNWINITPACIRLTSVTSVLSTPLRVYPSLTLTYALIRYSLCSAYRMLMPTPPSSNLRWLRAANGMLVYPAREGTCKLCLATFGTSTAALAPRFPPILRCSALSWNIIYQRSSIFLFKPLVGSPACRQNTRTLIRQPQIWLGFVHRHPLLVQEHYRRHYRHHRNFMYIWRLYSELPPKQGARMRCALAIRSQSISIPVFGLHQIHLFGCCMCWTFLTETLSAIKLGHQHSDGSPFRLARVIGEQTRMREAVATLIDGPRRFLWNECQRHLVNSPIASFDRHHRFIIDTLR